MSEHGQEVSAGKRFEFGKNWSRFLAVLDEDRILQAEQSLKRSLDIQDLSGMTFLDIGSGSGLFSLAARRLGAQVRSFDYDPDSVACTKELQARFFAGDSQWIVEEGSILDSSYIGAMSKYDIVYSWGVLHHTGKMWNALANAALLVKPGGSLLISIYNDQGEVSRRWTHVKRLYNRLPPLSQFVLLLLVSLYLGVPVFLRGLRRGTPLQRWRDYGKRDRAMSPWYDVVDWVGGYPFEVAAPDRVLDFLLPKGFSLTKLKTCGGSHGCNEYVFQRSHKTPSP